MLSFDPQTGISVSEVTDVREQVRAAWQKAFAEDGKPVLDTDPETPAGQLIDSQTASICEKDNELLFLANQFNPIYAEGKWQDALCKIYFLERHPATPSSTTLTCTGLYGTIIPLGAQVRDDNNNVWECTKATRIGSDGTAQVPFACKLTGPIEAKAHSIHQIGTKVAGWDTAINEEDATVGCDEETQAALEARRYQSVALNSRSSVQSVYSRIASLDDVIFCCVRQNRTSAEQTIDGVKLKPHSVYACVLGGSDEEIAEALYNSVSAGCDYTGEVECVVTDPVTGIKDQVRFSRPATKNFGVRVRVRKNQDTPPNIEDVVKAAIYDNFYGLSNEYVGTTPLQRVVGGDQVYASRFYPTLLAKGFNEILAIDMALPCDGASPQYSSSVAVPINVNPYLSKEHITVAIEVEE